MRLALNVASTMAIVFLAGCGAEPVAVVATPPPPVAVDVAAATLIDHGSVEVLPGTVKAAQAATLMARVPGTVARIAATPGDAVEAGAVLVELDAKELAARAEQTRAAAQQAAADLGRAQSLFATQAVTKAELDAVQARASGSAAAASEAAIMAGYVRIGAPFAGVVVRRHVEVGDLLSPGRPVIDLEDPSSLRLEVELPESLAAQVALGAKLRVQIGAAGLDQPAEVVEVTPASDPVSRSVLAKLALPNPGKRLRSGQFGRVSVPAAGGRMLAVPSSAVVQRGQLDAVFVVAEGRARLRLVRLGGVAGTSTTIRAGLAPGEAVVLNVPAGLLDGQAVTVR